MSQQQTTKARHSSLIFTSYLCGILSFSFLFFLVLPVTDVMHFSAALVAFGVSTLPFALGAPTPIAQEGQTGSVEAFSVSQVPVPRSTRKNGARAYAKALRKFNVEVPGQVKQAAAAAAASGSVPATPEANDEAYLAPVQIGTPAQTLNLDFDTGSADLWVFSNLLPSRESSGHTLYNSGSSSSASQERGETWDIQYGDGSGASGDVYADKVVIGGVTATSQAVEAATSVSSTFTSDTDDDGLVGLAFSSINTVTPQPATTFFDTVKGTLASPLFAAYLRHNAVGAYDFGATNPAHYTGTIGYTNVNTENGFWEFTAGTYSVGSRSYGSLGDTIADTGTSIILTSDAVVRNYYSQVSGAQNSEEYGGYVFPCSASLPDFSVSIAGATRTVPGSLINYAVAEGSTCYGGIQSSQGLPFTILGDTFLKTQYVVFNGASTPQIGFASQA